MSKRSGNLFGGVLLIAGSCIGAGMLGLPIVTGLCGYLPSLLMFLIAWGYMTTTGLLLVEANSWYNERVNLLTMVKKSLGKMAMGLCWATYLFLFYALLIAYISGSGSLFSSVSEEYAGIAFPSSLASIGFVALFGWLIYLGTRQVDIANRYMMGIKIASFFALVVLGIRYVILKNLSYIDYSKMVSSLPILVVSFGFHNMIPSLTSYMNGDIKKVRQAILGGSLLTLGVYVVWQTISLGIIPFEGANGIQENMRLGKEASQAIGSILKSSSVGFFAQILGFFAILTSFLAQALSVSHFLSDGFQIQYKKRENILMCALALLPPLLFALIYPDLFLKALGFAGGFCAVILFGIIPALMVWKGRAALERKPQYQVGGGKILLSIVLAFSVYIFFIQLSHMLS